MTKNELIDLIVKANEAHDNMIATVESLLPMKPMVCGKETTPTATRRMAFTSARAPAMIGSRLV